MPLRTASRRALPEAPHPVAALMAWLPLHAPRAPLAGLVLLALPWIASLQYYGGYPLRVIGHDAKGKETFKLETTKVEPGKLFTTQLDDLGNVFKEHEVPFKLSMMLPAFRGIKPVAGIEGLSNPRGFTIVDKHQQNPKYPNIFAVGVCVAIPPMGPTPVPCGVPKTAAMNSPMVEKLAPMPRKTASYSLSSCSNVTSLPTSVFRRNSMPWAAASNSTRSARSPLTNASLAASSTRSASSSVSRRWWAAR